MSEYVDNIKKKRTHYTLINNKKGITLVALIVTIVILLILAGIAIASLTGNGLFEKTKLAKEKQENADYEENIILGDYEAQINKIINANRNDENLQLKNCNIIISESGTITVQNVDKMIGFAIIQDEKCIEITKNATYSIFVPNGQTVKIYVIAIDENANLYKSNVVSYTGRAVYLYNEGEKCETITGGWVIWKDSNASANITDYNYMELNSYNASYCGLTVYTKNIVDITNYEKLKMDVTVISNGFTGGIDAGGYCLGISTSKIEGISGWATFNNSTERSLEAGEHINMELDISNNNGNYYIGVQTARFLLKIHKIWLE